MNETVGNTPKWCSRVPASKDAGLLSHLPEARLRWGVTGENNWYWVPAKTFWRRSNRWI